MLQAVDADIVCFQEENKETEFNIGVKRALGDDWHLAWSNGCAIVTKLPLKQLAIKGDRVCAGAVELEDGSHLVVISVHFKCCGYSGSSEDEARIKQAEVLANEIGRIRSGAFGDDYRKAPVVVLGDYNLVGSCQPVDVLEGAGLKPVMVRNLHDDSTVTWRGPPSETYWPGRLDWVTVGGVEPLRGFVLDTEYLPAELLKAKGLERDDSEASDHRMLVVDLPKAMAVE